MTLQQIVKWLLFLAALLFFFVPIIISGFDHTTIAFFLLLVAIFVQGEPPGPKIAAS